ncbi:MAG: hypothetical protein IJH90_05200 [Mogibacterium sp.]|nr:hypothetical protein [Mogibacterium sp.]
MSSSIDSDKLRAAKEKLACHIQPPGTHSPWADAVAAAGNQEVPVQSGEEIRTSSDRIRLTEMTAAGG